MENAPRTRVLVVLDDDAFAARVRDVIEHAGFRPFLASTAAEAHALLDQQLDPCVVLFALTPPNEGREFLGRLGASATADRMPVIFFPGSGRADPDAAEPIVSALLAFIQTYCESARDGDAGSALH